MGIGSSKGAFYEDEFAQQLGKNLNSADNNEWSPNEIMPQEGDAPRTLEAGGSMPFPDNNNPDTDFNKRFGTLPPSGILNDIKKPGDPTPPMVRRISDIHTSTGVTITDDDIDKAIGLGLSFSGGGLSTIRKGTQVRKGANDNVPDLVNPNLTPVEQLARKLAETENGKGSWDRIGGGGQEHYWRDAEKALKTRRPLDYDGTLREDPAVAWSRYEKGQDIIEQRYKLMDILNDRPLNDIEKHKLDKLNKEHDIHFGGYSFN